MASDRVAALQTRFSSPIARSATPSRATRVAPQSVERYEFKSIEELEILAPSPPREASAGAGASRSSFRPIKIVAPTDNIFDAADQGLEAAEEGLAAPPALKRTKVSAKRVSKRLRAIVHDIEEHDLCKDCIQEQLLKLSEALWELD